MISLNDITLEKLEQEMVEFCGKKFRATQLFEWFSKGVTDLASMTNLSADFKNKLSEKYSISTAEIEKKFESKLDGTKKYLIKFKDGTIVESVAMEYSHGISVCVSTQAGCYMGCRFCASTLNGKQRDLTPGEILGQIAIIQKDLDVRVSNIVLMGIGEPFDNFDNVITFLHNINNPKGIGLGMRHISISTCGLVDRINDFKDMELPVTLCISLHAPDDETRNKIMPINKKYNVEKLISACREYAKETGRRVTFEYILIDGLNDTVKHAEKLSKLLRGMLCHVNLIPANFVEECGFKPSTKKNIMQFMKILEDNRITATIRRELGSDISASCGQLRKKEVMKK